LQFNIIRKGSGVNVAIHEAAGPELLQTTKKEYTISKVQPGNVYPVSLSESCPLFTHQGTKHIIQAYGPNMNPKRANCLNGDYETGSALLTKVYNLILQSFENYYKKQVSLPVSSTTPTIQPMKQTNHTKSIPSSSSWSNKLYEYISNPHNPLVRYHDENVVIIEDKFPKAQFHFLVMPKEVIPKLQNLDSSHVALLHTMKSEALRLITEIDPNQEHKFRVGFHAVPSMNQIHVHVISQDFCSPSLKTKQHWNSFTSEFFLDADKVIEMFETDGKITVDKNHYESLLKKSLQCHKCSSEFANMPKLKQHITTCK